MPPELTPPPRARRAEGCLSDYALDQEVAGERTESRTQHLATCAECQSRFAQATQEKTAFRENAPPLRKQSVRSKRRVMIPGRFLGMLSLAAALLLFLAFRGKPGSREDGTRTKGGGAKLGFFVSHGGAVRRGGPDERVVPGDGLRFVVTASDPRYVAVLSIDGQHQASTYFPAAPVPAGQAVALPESTTLDDALGDETIYGVFCESPFSAAPLQQALAAQPAVAPVPPAGCTIDSLHLHKDAP